MQKGLSASSRKGRIVLNRKGSSETKEGKMDHIHCSCFAESMGWNVTAACSIHRNSDAARESNVATLLGEVRTAELLKLNELDMLLYEYVRQLATKQREEWQKTGKSLY